MTSLAPAPLLSMNNLLVENTTKNANVDDEISQIGDERSIIVEDDRTN